MTDGISHHNVRANHTGKPGHQSMHYVSTRGHAPQASFEDVLLAGLASDGGLYMPQSWPRLSLKPSAIPQHYAAAAAAIFGLFTDDAIGAEELALIAAEAYRAFPSPEAAPLKEIGPNLFLLELFHGPTFAFKDFAMQLLGRLMERELGQTGARTTILGATSGDTGAAAVEA